MAFTYSPKIVTDGLVFAVDAANKKSYPGSGTTWKDLSGNGNDGTLINGPTFDSGNGGSIMFDGANDIVEGNSNISIFNVGGGAHSVEWYTKYNNHSDYPTVWDLRFGTDIHWNDYINPIDSYRMYAYPGGPVRLSDSSIEINRWYHFIFSCEGNGNNFSFYINGILDYTAGWNRTYGNSTKYRIGGNNSSRRLNGNIPIIKFYNKALSASEVSQNYNALKSRFGL
jgi:hypothetical protein